MNNKSLVLAVALWAVASLAQEHRNYHIVDYYAYPHYSFEYDVHDPHTGDVKIHRESKKGDEVKGFYALEEPDGTRREVHYTADKKNGFNAIVKRIGHAVHPQPIYHKDY